MSHALDIDLGSNMAAVIIIFDAVFYYDVTICSASRLGVYQNDLWWSLITPKNDVILVRLCVVFKMSVIIHFWFIRLPLQYISVEANSRFLSVLSTISNIGGARSV
jgi:hypothetical protein